MGRTFQLKKMVLLILTGFFMTLAHAAAIQGEHEPRPHLIVQEQEPYVTVATDGSAETITPIVTSILYSTVSNISPIPDVPSTKTSLYNAEITMGTATAAPVAVSATSSDGCGTFLQCRDYRGVNGPFCTPRHGSQVEVGGTYYGKQ